MFMFRFMIMFINRSWKTHGAETFLLVGNGLGVGGFVVAVKKEDISYYKPNDCNLLIAVSSYTVFFQLQMCLEAGSSGALPPTTNI